MGSFPEQVRAARDRHGIGWGGEPRGEGPGGARQVRASGVIHFTRVLKKGGLGWPPACAPAGEPDKARTEQAAMDAWQGFQGGCRERLHGRR